MADSVAAMNNTYLPSFDATGNLIVQFSRNPRDFKVNQYVTLLPVDKLTGYYLRITPDQAVRLTAGDAANFAWNDGQKRPYGESQWNNSEFEFQVYNCHRYNFPKTLGYLAVEQASFDILAVERDQLATQAMTWRTRKVIAEASNTANYPSDHTSTASALGGGYWTAGTINDPIIQKTLMSASFTIMKDTNSAVKYTDLTLVVNPVLANAMARSQEIRAYLAQQAGSPQMIKGDVEGLNAAYGLPNRIYGMKLVVEDSVYISTKRNAGTTTKSFVLADTTALILARPGALTGGPGSNFSTVHVFSQEEMNFESRDEPIHRFHQLDLTDTFDAVVAAPASGYVVTACTA
jgi:hypothetical protein